MNFNYSKQPEYDLYNKLTHELTQSYGVPVKYVKTEKVSLDLVTFGEWTSLKADSNDITEIYLLPENTANYEGQNIMFDEFGLDNFSTQEFYISQPDLFKLFPATSPEDWHDSTNLNDMISDLIIVPSGKVLEVTHIEPLVDGVSNLFFYEDKKNSLKITTRNYQFRRADEISSDVLSPNNELSQTEVDTIDNLDSYFTKLLDSDIIPDKDYKPNEGNINTLDYEMKVQDIMFFNDSLVINTDTVGIIEPLKTVDDALSTKIVEASLSQKGKQDKKPRKNKVREKSGEFSNPFGELG